MRVLRVITSMNPENGGPCQGIRNSIPALEKIGVYNEVVCFDSPDAGFLGNDSFKIHAIGPSKGPYAYCPSLHQWLLDNFSRFDAVIIHGLWLYNNFGTYKAWKKYKSKHGNAPKLYVMPHGMLDPYFQKAPERKLKAIRNSVFWKLFEKRAVNGATGVLFTCQEELILARQTFNDYKPEQELNVGYGIQQPPVYMPAMTEAFLEKCPQLKDSKFILFLSRIHEKKGVDLLVKAYLKLKDNNIDVAPLVIAGPGLDTDFGQEIKKLAEKDSNIIFPGMLSGNSKWGAFYNCEAFILPSHQENFGISVVEAMATGSPVLISKQVNIWREIDNGNAGLIGNDTEEDTYKILFDWSNLPDEEKKAMGNNALEVYKAKFTIEQAALQMVSKI
ncbi:glycosyltransferase [Flavobacterium sp. Sd200]|uniref:glycosyltransferase n=1 Tax=Flavobacterium sp. Sd200 TaxID=2692211 RepID=UPI001369981E|nr:glycosyltransferase [Flavobacterium sp. Sd200]MXN91975.1 glycosyltransferase [Flavobacterium sp. Sd200]